MIFGMVRLPIQFSIKANTADRGNVVCQQKVRSGNLSFYEYWRFVQNSEFLTSNNEIKANVNIADEFEIGEEEMTVFFTEPDSHEQWGSLERGGISFLFRLAPYDS